MIKFATELFDRVSNWLVERITNAGDYFLDDNATANNNPQETSSDTPTIQLMQSHGSGAHVTPVSSATITETILNGGIYDAWISEHPGYKKIRISRSDTPGVDAHPDVYSKMYAKLVALGFTTNYGPLTGDNFWSVRVYGPSVRVYGNENLQPYDITEILRDIPDIANKPVVVPAEKPVESPSTNTIGVVISVVSLPNKEAVRQAIRENLGRILKNENVPGDVRERISAEIISIVDARSDISAQDIIRGLKNVSSTIKRTAASAAMSIIRDVDQEIQR